MPSVFSFQYPPVALCMPRRPAGPFFFSDGAVEAAGVAGLASDSDVAALPVPVEVKVEAVGTVCWTIVLLMASL